MHVQRAGETIYVPPGWPHAVVRRQFSEAAVHAFRDGQLDFIYVDARHDYLGALQDMLLWWPLLRCGGIMAGHDYVTQEEVSRSSTKVKQDWTKNFDGTVDETRRVLKGAADDFSSFINRQLTISYQEGAWHTWAVRK